MTDLPPVPALALPAPVLVVEDEPLVRARLERLLHQLGYPADALLFAGSLAEARGRLADASRWRWWTWACRRQRHRADRRAARGRSGAGHPGHLGLEHRGRHSGGAARRRHRLPAEGTRRPGSADLAAQRARRRADRSLRRPPHHRGAAPRARAARQPAARRNAQPARRPDPAPGGRGLGNREIADQLHLSRYTVECHIKHIYRKLAVSSRTRAIHAALARPARLTRPTPVARRAGQALAAMLGLLALLILCGGARAATADAAGDAPRGSWTSASPRPCRTARDPPTARRGRSRCRRLSARWPGHTGKAWYRIDWRCDGASRAPAALALESWHRSWPARSRQPLWTCCGPATPGSPSRRRQPGTCRDWR